MAPNLCLFHPGKSLNESHGWNTLGSMQGFLFSATFFRVYSQFGGLSVESLGVWVDQVSLIISFVWTKAL